MSSETKVEDDTKEQTAADDDAPKSPVYKEEDETRFLEDKTDSDSQEDKDPLPHAQEPDEEQTIKKKYGGLAPKKLPLISKDHDHAFFDSADWALGKQGGAQKSKGPLEALRPKLQPSPHQQIRSRRSTYVHAAEYEDHEGCKDNCNPSKDDLHP